KLLRPSSPVIAKASTMCTYSLVPITLAPADNRDRHRNQEYSLIACLLILDYYPKCALLHARLKKLYFFQIVKERKNSDLEKTKPKPQRLTFVLSEPGNGGG
ncbi:hypothetical protein LE190_21535, partial [Massilia oculi]